MIIKKFEEIVRRFPGREALKTNNQSLTYEELNFKANQVTHAIITKSKEAGAGAKKQQVALLFDYGSDMIVGLLGVLKAGKTYVPLDFNYPGKRLLSIIENADSDLILTDNGNYSLACELAGHADMKIAVLNINDIGTEIPGTPMQREASAERPAYILYTSGSTGKPKGVFQIHRNVLYYAQNWIKRFSITESERMSLFTAFTHDGAVPDIYSGLLSGACLYPYAIKESGSVGDLSRFLANEKITIWHSTPSFFRYFTGNLAGAEHFPDIRWVLLGGEPIRAHDLELYKTHFAGGLLVSIYGQTECTVSSFCVMNPQDTIADLSLGEPLDEATLFLMDEAGDIVEDIGGGEIIVACPYSAPGYWQDSENSRKVFLRDEQMGYLYRTGDMGLLTANGSIKILGRKDFQVKIRGYRIELGEIETELLRNHSVAEAIVTAIEDENNENYLCAYIVPNMAVSSEDLREYLFSELPDYMVPRYFIFMEKMPLTSSGKIDRRLLPKPGITVELGATYVPPANETEEKITAIWQDVLKVEKIGVNDNFTELGGHSLLIMSITSKIHRELDVELQMTDVFDNPTIRELARLVLSSKQTRFSAIEPAEKKEYYPLSPAQKRLYVLQQMKLESTVYNLPAFFTFAEELTLEKLTGIFGKLLNRHESFRTSFIIVANEPVQRIHQHVELQPRYFEAAGKEEIKKIMADFTQPFDLCRVPLLRATIIKTEGGQHIIMTDMHHIISDSISIAILLKDFASLFKGNALAPLKLQYKDFSEWRNSKAVQEDLQRQEQYWLKELSGGVPVLNLPIDYNRAHIRDFAGSSLKFEIDAETTGRLNALAKEEELTVYMILFSIFNVLLAKLALQEDIVVGTDTAGRNHADLEPIVGMFINTLALRTFPSGEKRFQDFLIEVKQEILAAFANQDYPLEELVGKVVTEREPGRNPLFDVMFTYEKSDSINAGSVAGEPEKVSRTYNYINKTAKFDLLLMMVEAKNKIIGCFEYSTHLFKEERIKNYIRFFQEISCALLDDRTIQLKDIPMNSRHLEAETIDLSVDFAFNG